MTHEDYRRALESATREYEDLGAKRQAIDKRLAELAQTIGTLSKLIGLTPTVPLGLTDAVRLVMRGGVPMTPVEVRDRLRRLEVRQRSRRGAHDPQAPQRVGRAALRPAGARPSPIHVEPAEHG